MPTRLKTLRNAIWITVITAVAAQGESLTPVGTDVIIRTNSGVIVGLSMTGIQEFRGIPYAEPPTGKRRFRTAVPVKPWSKPRQATSPAPACCQVPDLDDPAEDGDSIMSEDCLSLNVWTPDSKSGRRPVMVFIHGGGFEEGSAANSWYNGAALARAGDVVVVTLQYRLGSLGFLELSKVGGPGFSGSGNVGLTDQIEALRWIQQNIRQFGGDPDNVTIFGESAGGASVRALMAIPAARALFHKVIIESGSGHYIKKARAQEIGVEFAKLAGATEVAALQRLTPEAVMRVQAQFFSSGYGSMPFGIVEDGTLFTQSPTQAVSADSASGKPMIIGTNAEEIRYWVAMDANGVDRQPEGPLRERLTSIFGPQVGDPLSKYKADSESTEEAITTLLGDAVFRMPSIRLAEINAVRQPTYMYLFDYRSVTRGQTGLEYGAMHGLEVAFVFQLDTTQGYLYVGPRATWRHLSDQMAQAWTTFARTGNPNGPQLPTWPTYDTRTRATMTFGHHSDTVLDPHGAQRRAWEGALSDSFDSVLALGLTDIATPNDK